MYLMNKTDHLLFQKLTLFPESSVRYQFYELFKIVQIQSSPLFLCQSFMVQSKPQHPNSPFHVATLESNITTLIALLRYREYDMMLDCSGTSRFKCYFRTIAELS